MGSHRIANTDVGGRSIEPVGNYRPPSEELTVSTFDADIRFTKVCLEYLAQQ